jgi:single-strand DNA-binding protein
MSVNKVTLLGNVGQTPEIRSTQAGAQIASFSIATTDYWKDKTTGDKKDKTEWHRIVVFGDALVNVVKNIVKKGSKVYLEGALQTRKWQDQSGVEKYTTEIVLQGYAAKIEVLDRRDASGGEPSNEGSFSNSSSKDNDFGMGGDSDDEVPF